MRAVVLHSKMAVRRLQRHGREIRARGGGEGPHVQNSMGRRLSPIIAVR